MKDKWKRYILLYGCILAVIFAGIIGLQQYCEYSSQKLYTYFFSGEALFSSQDDLSIDVDRSKEWIDETFHKDYPAGGQYDFLLINNSSKAFKDWFLDIEYSDSVAEDSSWNGVFIFNDNHIMFTPNSERVIAFPESSQDFGAVIYSEDYPEPVSFTLNGYWDINILNYPAFWVLIAIATIVGIIAIIHAVVLIKMYAFMMQRAHDTTIIEQSMNTITGFIDAKDYYTKGHSLRVASYAEEIAKRLKFPEEKIREVYYITLMHDCGKIGIPDAILKKPGRLTEEEFEIIKQHTVIGYEILENFTALDGIRDGAHYHHERYDGHGYPEGLKGDAIPHVARIICVADSFDAMSSNRCYRPALSDDMIKDELKKNSGKQFAPSLVPIMIDMMNDGFVNKIKLKYPS